VLLPAHDLGNDTDGQASGMKPRCSGSAKVVEVKVTVDHPGVDLGPVEGAAKAVLSRRPMSAVGRIRSLRDAVQKAPEDVAEGDDDLTAPPTLASRDDGVGADMQDNRARSTLQNRLQKRSAQKSAKCWSGRRESNPRMQLWKLAFYH
jgi:hypothetical protein